MIELPESPISTQYLAPNLYKLRTDLNLSREQVVLAINADAPAWWDGLAAPWAVLRGYESGELVAYPSRVEPLADYYGVTLEQLTGGLL